MKQQLMQLQPTSSNLDKPTKWQFDPNRVALI